MATVLWKQNILVPVLGEVSNSSAGIHLQLLPVEISRGARE